MQEYKRTKQANECKSKELISQRQPADGGIKAEHKDTANKIQGGKKDF